MGRTLSGMVHRKRVRGLGRGAGEGDVKRTVPSVSESGGCASWPAPRRSVVWEAYPTQRCGLEGEWLDLQKGRLKLWLVDHSGESACEEVKYVPYPFGYGSWGALMEWSAA